MKDLDSRDGLGEGYNGESIKVTTMVSQEYVDSGSGNGGALDEDSSVRRLVDKS